MGDRPLILVDPLPRILDLICEPEAHRRPEALFQIGRMMVADAELILRGLRR